MCELGGYLDQLALTAPGVREIWLIGSRANGTARADSDWDLVVFGDARTLQQLREAVHLHRADVDCLVVADEGSFQSAWGTKSKGGSLSGWKWRPHADGKRAIYSESKWHDAEDGAGVRTADRLALLKWPAP